MNKSTNTETTGSETLSERVARFKIIARDSLRANLISARASKIANLEASLKDYDEQKTKVELDETVEKYEISKMDTEHPLYEKRKKAREDHLPYFTERLETITKNVEAVNKSLTEQKEAVAKIESGETKVSIDALNDLVNEMVRADGVARATCGTC